MTPACQTKKFDFLISFLSIALSCLLFALAFPNIFTDNGFAPALWAAYIPVFLVINRAKAPLCLLWGLIYGAASTFLLNYWLFTFDRIAGIFVICLYGVYFSIFFLLLKCANLIFRRGAPLVQTTLWTAFEYLRTLGFLGYSYGITAYSQWTLLPLIKIADIFGLWFISALLIFPQAELAGILSAKRRRTGNPKEASPALRTLASYAVKFSALPLWFVVLVLTLVYGFLSKTDYSAEDSVRVALVQPDSNPWKSGVSEYRREFNDLKFLSDLALSEVPPPELVVWPETAFVPSFYYHTRYRPDTAYYTLVKEAQDYISRQAVPFVVGNDESRRVSGPSGDEIIAHYNAVLLFSGDKVTDRYYKMRLVPFSEYFPYRTLFPKIYEVLSSMVTHFWTPGTTPVVFDVNGFKFSTPVCFEDSFDYISRDFVKGGAQFIVNLTNDSWANSLPAQKVHLAMSVFRAVENRRAVVRSATSGETCAIDPNGKILALAEPFTKTTISVEIPLMNSVTIYTHAGNIFPVFCILFSPLALISGLVSILYRKFKH